MEYKEKWAIPVSRLEQFFLSAENAQWLGTGHFLCGQCNVRLTALPEHSRGPIQIPYTLVEISGEEDAAEALYHRFFLRFISAGG